MEVTCPQSTNPNGLDSLASSIVKHLGVLSYLLLQVNSTFFFLLKILVIFFHDSFLMCQEKINYGPSKDQPGLL